MARKATAVNGTKAVGIDAWEMYETLGTGIGRLVGEKQGQYGDSFGRAGGVLRILYPNGVSPEAMDDALAVVRVVDKLFRIATAAGGKDGGGESPWRDIAGYALLGYRRQLDKESEEPK